MLMKNFDSKVDLIDMDSCFRVSGIGLGHYNMLL